MSNKKAMFLQIFVEVSKAAEMSGPYQMIVSCYANLIFSAPLDRKEQVSTNTGPSSAARYINQFSHLCCSVDKYSAVNPKDLGSIPTQGDFFHLNFFH